MCGLMNSLFNKKKKVSDTSVPLHTNRDCDYTVVDTGYVKLNFERNYISVYPNTNRKVNLWVSSDCYIFSRIISGKSDGAFEW